VAALLAAMAVYMSGTREELASIRRLSAGILVITCSLQFLSHLFLNGSFLLPLRRCVAHLGFWELYLVRTGGFFAGSVVPVAGGLAVRLAYLKGRGLTYLEFTWATLLSNVLALGAAAVLAVVAIGVLWSTAGRPPVAILAVSGGVLAISLAAMAAFEYLPGLTRHPKLRRWSWLADMRRPSENHGLAMSVFGLSVLRHGINFVTFGLLYQTLTRAPGSVLPGGLVYALTSPIRIVNITPANLGVTEWFVALVGSMVSFDVATGLIVSLAFRGVALIAQGIGALVGSAWIALKGHA
jgi:Lysylphosphatidylglycerol synthase TM region